MLVSRVVVVVVVCSGRCGGRCGPTNAHGVSILGRSTVRCCRLRQLRHGLPGDGKFDLQLDHDLLKRSFKVELMMMPFSA